MFTKFKKFKLHVEKESGCKLKKLRTGGDGEYTSQEFARFCNEEGIKNKVTTPNKPQHNGITDRKNQSILNMTRSMLKAKDMPNKFWGEAASTIIYILKR